MNYILNFIANYQPNISISKVICGVKNSTEQLFGYFFDEIYIDDFCNKGDKELSCSHEVWVGDRKMRLDGFQILKICQKEKIDIPEHFKKYIYIAEREKVKYAISTNNIDSLKQVLFLENQDLQFACRYGTLEMVKYLVEERKIKVDPCDVAVSALRDDSTFLEYFEENNYDLKQKCNKCSYEFSNQTPLEVASKNKKTDNINYLINLFI